MWHKYRFLDKTNNIVYVGKLYNVNLLKKL